MGRCRSRRGGPSEEEALELKQKRAIELHPLKVTLIIPAVPPSASGGSSGSGGGAEDADCDEGLQVKLQFCYLHNLKVVTVANMGETDHHHLLSVSGPTVDTLPSLVLDIIMIHTLGVACWHHQLSFVMAGIFRTIDFSSKNSAFCRGK
jgi:hypothetical protein